MWYGILPGITAIILHTGIPGTLGTGTSITDIIPTTIPIITVTIITGMSTVTRIITAITTEAGELTHRL
jgi:hypothetical protein